ncbi:MAG TPA: DUF2231 domain-containing protein, partial [Saprospiraceae bacterium]|nr:DUF2231 domain-containing protein [Saprospiraceae bacterium]
MHFPIALLMVGFASELFGRLSGRSFFSRMGFYLLLLGTAGAVVSYLSGDAAGEGMEEGSLEAAVEEHEESALVTLILALATSALYGWNAWRANTPGWSGWLGVLLFATTIVSLGVTGYYGGQLVYRHEESALDTLILALATSALYGWNAWR